MEEEVKQRASRRSREIVISDDYSADRLRDRVKEISEERAGMRMNARDVLYIPPEMIPAGWRLAWIRVAYRDRPDHAREMEVLRKGWQPVHPSKYPHLMVKDYGGSGSQSDNVIIINGLMLVTRPEIFSIEEERERETHNMQIASSLEGLKNFMGENTYVPGLKIEAPINITYEKGPQYKVQERSDRLSQGQERSF